MDYSPAPESAPVHIAKQYQLFIGGDFVEGTGEHLDALNPATGVKLASFPCGTKHDINKAVKAARRAFDGPWSSLTPGDRAVYLYHIARAITERSRELAIVETLNNGKPIRETRDIDVPLAAAHFFYYAGWADKLEYAGLGQCPKPHGVAGQVIPWNFPLLMLAWKIAPALACGNTVVLKPAETTPLTALLFAEICQSVGLPDGVVNIVTGDGATGRELISHPGVDKLAFTGSTEVGRSIAEAAAMSGKSLTLELGGKGANIVFSDAALDQAVEGIVNGVFFNQGHVCCAGSRLLVQEPIAEEVLQRLRSRMQLLRLGDPLDKNTDVGAINSAEQLQRIESRVREASSEGAQVWHPACALPSRGFWYRPTLLQQVSGAHTASQEEIFGPVLSVMTFRTEEEAIVKANNTPYGLSAGVWSANGARSLAVASKLKAGVVWTNTFNQFDPASPFGGFDQSGYGREGGPQGLKPYLKATVTTGGTQC